MSESIPEDIITPGDAPLTIPAMLERRARQTPDRTALYYKEDGIWATISWSEYWTSVQNIASQLHQHGISAGANIAIILPTCKEWEFIDKAALALGAVVVGIEPHIPNEHINAIIELANTSVLVVQDLKQALALGADTLHTMDLIITLANDPPLTVGPTVTWAQLIKPAAAEQAIKSRAKSTAPAAVIFTSGTTGSPKAIQYSHSQVMAACYAIRNTFNVSEQDIGICWLPLANLFQRIVNLCAMSLGSATYIVEDPKKIMDEVVVVQPTYFIGVPRVYEKIYKGIQAKFLQMPAWMGKCITFGLDQVQQRQHMLERNRPIPAHIKLTYFVMNITILRALRNIMGGNLKFMVTGSAACPEWITRFFHAIGIPLLEAYGVSENIIPISANQLNDYQAGSVGKPLPGNQVTVSDEGEILVKGPGLFQGYQQSSSTDASFTKEGYYRTSDYGYFDHNGYLHITGRNSDIIKTSTGRRIPLTRIESLLQKISVIDQAIVMGNGKRLLVTIITLDQERLSELGIFLPQTSNDNELTAIEQYAFINSIIAKEIRTATISLAPYEQIAGCLISPTPFSIENGELTRNLKIRRQAIEAQYHKSIEQLYQTLEHQEYPNDKEISILWPNESY